MEWINKYWKIILTVASIISSGVALQIQAAQNSKDIELNKQSITESSKHIIAEIEKGSKLIKERAEKNYAEAKKERDALKAQQQQQTILKVNQQYIIEGLKEMKSLVKDLSKEIRENRK